MKKEKTITARIGSKLVTSRATQNKTGLYATAIYPPARFHHTSGRRLDIEFPAWSTNGRRIRTRKGNGQVTLFGKEIDLLKSVLDAAESHRRD